MIFTHIFHYLDDRDAAEEVRRTGGSKANMSSLPSRFHAPPSWRHDVRFNQISLAAPAAPQTSLFHGKRKDCFAQGFCSLRAQTRPSPKPRVLPPICNLQSSGGERRLWKVEQDPTKLPPIEENAGKTQNADKQKRSNSRRNIKDVMTSDAIVPNSTPSNQRMLLFPPVRFGDDDATCECSRSTDTMSKWDGSAIVETKIGADHLFIEEKEICKTGKLDEANSHDLCEAELNKNIDSKELRNSTREVIVARKYSELTGIDAIKASKGENNAYGQLGNAQGTSSRKAADKAETIGDSPKYLAADWENETENLNVSTTNMNEQEDLICRLSNEYMQFPDSKERTSRKKSKVFEFISDERERRYAICEVLEKTSTPAYGTSLYEMRQNLIHLKNDSNSFLRRLKQR